MRLQIEGIIATGTVELDLRTTDLEVYAGTGGVIIYAASGRNGGVAGWRLDAAGHLVLHSTVVFPPQIAGIVSDRIVLDTGGGAAQLYVGADAAGLIAYGINADLSLGARLGVTWTEAQGRAMSGRTPALEALVIQSPQGPLVLPPGCPATQIVDLHSVTVAGRDIVVIACAETDSLRTMIRDPATRALIPADVFGAADGLGIRAPTGMEVVTIDGATYAVLVAAGTSSISVLRVGVDGRLEPVEHVIDTGSTRFEGVQAVAVVQAGAHTFVLAGGADHGVTLFLMLPDGRLVWLDTVADTADLSVANVGAIAAVVQGDEIHILVGSSRDAGLTHLTVPIADLGALYKGTAGQARLIAGSGGDDILIARTGNDTLNGGAGEDVLVSGPGRTYLRGGADGDVFVIRAGTTRADILGFQPGLDRLDLGDLPMLRDLSQLRIIPTADGARIEYRGAEIVITSANGQPLSAEDLFPHGLEGPDRLPILPREYPPEPDREIFGTAGDDTLPGGRGNDTIWGQAGNDSIRLIGGNNLVYGGDGNDTIAAGPGEDTIYAGAGNDLLYGTGGGRNTLGGGPGKDTIHGGPDPETIFGGTGDDLLYSGGSQNRVYGSDGNDLIYGGDGGNGLGGGPGNDTVWGGQGNDTVWGIGGDDRIYGVGGDNQLWGGPGHDTITGGPGRDVLGGGPGKDFVYGGEGDDLIYGGPGDDRYWGGAGADRFVFSPGAEMNRILDFNPAEGDRIQLYRGLWAGAGALTAAEIVARFGAINEWGNLVLNFGEVGGTIFVLVGFNDFDALIAAIDIA